MNKAMGLLFLALACVILCTSVAFSDEIATIVDNISKARSEIVKINDGIKAHNEKAQDWHDRFADLKAKAAALGGECHWQGDPHQCDEFVRKSKELDKQLDGLLAEQVQLEAELQGLNDRGNYQESHISVQIGLLKAKMFLGCLEPFRDAVVACSQFKPIPAAGCLSELWAKHC